MNAHSDLVLKNNKITLYFPGISNSNVSEWERVWDLYLNEQEPHEKMLLLKGLAASKDPQLLTRRVLCLIL